MTTAAAIVTGASSGIGRAIARALAGAGYAVTLTGRDEARLRHAAAGLELGRTLVVPCDLADEAAPRRLVDATLARFGRLDVLVNDAGDAAAAPIDATTPAAWARLLDLNARAPALLIAAAWPTFTAQRRGVVINVSSLAAHDPFPGFFVYAASKAALESLARSVAREAAPGVRAYNVAPGVTDTPLAARLFGATSAERAGWQRPDDVAALVLRCASGAVDAPSGSTLFVAPGAD